MTLTLSLLSRVGRAISSSSSSSSSSSVLRVVASSPAPPSRRSSSHAPSLRTITTKSKNTGPALPTAEEERDTEGHSYIVESECLNWPRPKEPLQDFALKDLLDHGNKTAVECGLTGRSYTHTEIYDGIMRFGGALQKLKVMKEAGRRLKEEGKGPTIAILSPNCPEYPIAFFGGLVAGGTVTTINPAFTPNEVAYHLKNSDTEVVVVDALVEPLIDAALALLGKEEKALVEGMAVFVNGVSKSGRPNLRDIAGDTKAPFVAAVEPPIDATAILPYSSGTTGLPKGVCISHDNFTATLHAFHHPTMGPTQPVGSEGQEVLLGLLPFYHVYGMALIMTSGMMNGFKTVTVPVFDPKAFVSTVAAKKVSILHLVPPLLNFLALNPAVPAAAWSSVHTFICTAAPVPPSSAAILKNKAKHDIAFHEGYGTTETLGVMYVPKGSDRLGWCGKPIANTRMKVVDVETRELLPSGQAGELCVDAPSTMKGYYKNEKETRDTFDDEGWFKTGDVAVYDDEGYFKIVDRLKELIKVKGIQVSPSELEDILLTHPGVAEVGVVGVPDEKAGEVPRAYVVPRSKDVKAEELSAFVASKVARHKHLLGGVEFLKELPKNATGKVLKRELRGMIRGE